jgi:glycerol-3-phosphate dehydrogenase (NAD(P)+)
VHLARIGHDVSLWARDRSLVQEMRERRANAVYLADVTLPDRLSVTDSMESCLAEAELVVSATPSHGCRAVMRAAAPHLRRGATVVSATKGLESRTFHRMSEVVRQEIGSERPVVVLSGPSFAAEVAQAVVYAAQAAPNCCPDLIELRPQGAA